MAGSGVTAHGVIALIKGVSGAIRFLKNGKNGNGHQHQVVTEEDVREIGERLQALETGQDYLRKEREQDREEWREEFRTLRDQIFRAVAEAGTKRGRA